MQSSTGYQSGNITAINSVPNGAASANSAVELDLNGSYNTVGIQVTGTYTGALSVQFTIDGTRWETVGGTVVGNSIEDISVGTSAATIASGAVGVRRIRSSGMGKVRVTALAAVTGTAVVTLIATR